MDKVSPRALREASRSMGFPQTLVSKPERMDVIARRIVCSLLRMQASPTAMKPIVWTTSRADTHCERSRSQRYHISYNRRNLAASRSHYHDVVTPMYDTTDTNKDKRIPTSEACYERVIPTATKSCRVPVSRGDSEVLIATHPVVSKDSQETLLDTYRHGSAHPPLEVQDVSSVTESLQHLVNDMQRWLQSIAFEVSDNSRQASMLFDNGDGPAARIVVQRTGLSVHVHISTEGQLGQVLEAHRSDLLQSFTERGFLVQSCVIE